MCLYFGHLMQRANIGKDSDAGKDWGQEGKGMTEDEMVGWHHRLNGHRFGWTPELIGSSKCDIYKNSKASVLQCSALFMVQFSHPYMTTGKIIALTLLTFVGKTMSLLFNTLPRFVIAFLLRSKYLLISVYKVGCDFIVTFSFHNWMWMRPWIPIEWADLRELASMTLSELSHMWHPPPFR